MNGDVLLEYQGTGNGTIMTDRQGDWALALWTGDVSYEPLAISSGLCCRAVWCGQWPPYRPNPEDRTALGITRRKSCDLFACVRKRHQEGVEGRQGAFGMSDGVYWGVTAAVLR
ncbi:hypothetical protein ACFVXE_11910 [Streptomyces sp. NPDC058231]|uniref:hypothetical protein n=1 Tax=Streptomyces sp. NPDC058231 TaxID=3346392 RepID=UPI0036E117B0